MEKSLILIKSFYWEISMPWMEQTDKHGTPWDVLVPGKMNSNGLMLLELYIASTHFMHKSDGTTMLMHPRSKVWDFLDYVIIR